MLQRRSCSECTDYPCDNIKECFAVTKSFEPMCRRVWGDEEYRRLYRVFFEKEKNLALKQVKPVPVGKEDIVTVCNMQVEVFLELLDHVVFVGYDRMQKLSGYGVLHQKGGETE